MANNHRQTTGRIIFDEEGYRYREKSKNTNKRYYVCCEATNYCPGKAIRTTNGNIVLTAGHLHAPRLNQMTRDVFNTQLRQAVQTTDENSRTIYNRIALNNSEAATATTFASKEHSMRRWRQVPHPPIPATLSEYARLINEDRWISCRDYSQGRLQVRTIVIDDKASITVLGDPEFLGTLHNIQTMYIDATFKVCPRKPKKLQLVTLMGKIDETPKPLAWVLMTKKTQVAYRTALQLFKDEFALHFRPTTVHTDFEAAIGNAMRQIYQGISVIPCYFHHIYAIYNRILSEGGKAMLDTLSRWDLAKTFYRKLITIALLPAANIIAAFQWLTDNTPPDIMEFFERLFSYYSRTWLRNYGPEKFSMYRLHERTNNSIEAYHRTLASQLGIHSNIWKFTDQLKKLQGIIRLEISSLDRGLQVRRTRMQRYENREVVLAHMWEKFDNGVLNIPRFLACANHISEAFDNKIIMKTAADVDRLTTAPIHDVNVQPTHIRTEEIVLEGFNAQDPVPIIEANPTMGFMNFLILEDKQRSLCTSCHNSFLNMMTLPCRHWFLCRNCTTARALQWAQQQQPPMCIFCNRECIAFQTVEIS